MQLNDPARGLLLVALAAVLPASCGGSNGPVTPGQPGVLSKSDEFVEPLLARASLERVADVAAYEPEAEGFGERGLGGWRHLTEVHQGRDCVITVHGLGRLRLTAGQPRDRRITFEAARGPGLEGAEPATLSAELGGEHFELGELSGEWREYGFEVPAKHWTEGGNRLVLQAHPEGNQESRLLAVASVHVDAVDDAGAAEPKPSPGSATPGTERLGAADAVRMQVAGTAGGSLTVALEAQVGGELLIRLVELNPTTGLAGRVALEEAVGVSPGKLTTSELELPSDAPPLAELELRWYPDDDRGSATLVRADLNRATGKPPALVIFLSVDTLAALNMSLYGYGRETTPGLDRLAGSSFVFDRATSNSGWTLPSYISQLTALLPNSHRVTTAERREDATIYSEFQLTQNRLTMAELMNAAGYETGAIVDNPFIANLRGVGQGFERFDITPSERELKDFEGGIQLVNRTALEWIDGWDQKRPLFLFLQVLDVHGPYITTAPWRGTFKSAEQGPLAPLAGTFVTARGSVPDYVALGAQELGFERTDVAPVGAILDAYDEKVLEMDARIAQLLDALAERGLRDDVLFVLSADHGEVTTQRGMYFRHGSVYEPSIHVPLLIDLPGAQKAGVRVEDRVQLVDLMPTLAELAGLDPEPFSFHGRSLVPLLRGESLKPRPVVVQTTFKNQRAVLHGDWKLIFVEPWMIPNLSSALTWDYMWEPWAEAFPELAAELAGTTDLSEPPRYDQQRFEAFDERHPKVFWQTKMFFKDRGPVYRLYNLADDPLEEHDLASARPDMVATLRALLDHSETMTVESQLLAELDQSENQMSEAVLAELALLGYVDPADVKDDADDQVGGEAADGAADAGAGGDGDDGGAAPVGDPPGGDTPGQD
ncbi:sulfatase [Engelhardtia mirabilis]|uniref:Choline-sulfatase n=1 Tax=Engelhardtia mirabilis TaxID=2528011 RepID=A0A518BHG9_9BACT|nr:Choline-sulfatase [Planctomycetes bacterium Pla133]QDV00753.1 Choline-sulfatase [Planctomycetes bacterium Pla86]